MPRFFFDISDGRTSFRDSEGSDADNLTAAKVLARQALYEALRDNVRDDAATSKRR